MTCIAADLRTGTDEVHLASIRRWDLSGKHDYY